MILASSVEQPNLLPLPTDPFDVERIRSLELRLIGKKKKIGTSALGNFVYGRKHAFNSPRRAGNCKHPDLLHSKLFDMATRLPTIVVRGELISNTLAPRSRAFRISPVNRDRSAVYLKKKIRGAVIRERQRK